jgi:hypothetical protein
VRGPARRRRSPSIGWRPITPHALALRAAVTGFLSAARWLSSLSRPQENVRTACAVPPSDTSTHDTWARPPESSSACLLMSDSRARALPHFILEMLSTVLFTKPSV